MFAAMSKTQDDVISTKMCKIIWGFSLQSVGTLVEPVQGRVPRREGGLLVSLGAAEASQGRGPLSSG